MDGPSNKGSSRSEKYLPNYRLGKTLGIGSFGKVKLAQHVLTGHKVAIKILDRQMITDLESEKVRREIKILRLFAHPHIIRLYEVIETRTNIYVVMEYMKSGELFYHITEKGKLEEDEARFLFQQIISGVEFCHLNMVVHRDLKPENLLMDSKRNVKVADFGLSNIMRDGHFLKTSCGSPNYAAPEVVSGQLYAGPEVDVWSCGVILYALLCGRLPFDADNLSSLFKKIKSGIYTLPSHLSPGSRDLIPRMLIVDPIKRITIPEIRQHPWFQDNLPRYLAVPAIDAMQRVKRIDDDILQEVLKIGFDRNEVIESIQGRMQNEATVTYYLLLDNRFRVSNGYLGSEFHDVSESNFSSLHLCNATPSVTRQSLQLDHRGVCSRPQYPTERKWALGLQSRAPPREIMMEVLRALQSLNVCWKKIGHYNMKCSWFPSFAMYPETTNNIPLRVNNGKSAIIGIDEVGIRSQNTVKFEMQLYKAREEKYLLDLQRVHGPPMLFLEICVAFLAQLRVM
eukprot:TRINITY_DN1505_c0_g1_i1.p1 TRINITY_DN1505_c0_g1~~TRINITY_DN1505_c0_g1_i1.p1  ORF type:complete len:511 (-),score=69.23 TRINITY_DN1505_c0_g1_i1:299-1831(-)